MNWIKSLLPLRFKDFLWFIFKSPQRTFVGWGTLLTDIAGWSNIYLFPSRRRPVTICTGLKNRSDNYLKYVLGSLNKCSDKELITLSIFDCVSEDIPDLEGMIRSKWKGNLVFNSQNIPFSRSIVFDKAIEQAPDTDLIFVCDADIELPQDIVKKINFYCTNKSTWFPILFFESEDNTEDPVKKGAFKKQGKGICAFSKEQYKKAGGYDRSITTWGDEDWKLFFDLYRAGYRPYRSYERNMIHRFHTSMSPAGYRSRYTS